MTAEKTIIVIGAGPKAMAIATKNQCLRELGFRVPQIHVIEKSDIAANWTGENGFTNGRLSLGTSPEKDVGFPYQSASWGKTNDVAVDRLMARYCWQSFLIDRGVYSDWVDRGRPAPEHRQWANYLQWVSRRVGEGIQVHRGEVTKAQMRDGRWMVTYQTPNFGEVQIEGDGLVLTGPGRIRRGKPSSLPQNDRVLTVENFWKRYLGLCEEASRRIDKHSAGLYAEQMVPSSRLKPIRLAIVGSGENAASIAMALSETGVSGIQVDIISPTGMAFSRGESFRENRVYSDPALGKWSELSEEDRRNFIYRTDRGVFSQYAQTTLDRAANVDVIPGRVSGMETNATSGLLDVSVEYAKEKRNETYDYVVLATGVDQLGFLRDLIDAKTESLILANSGLSSLTTSEVENAIDESLSVEGLTPRLHLPMLSGMRQGPGFSNLSCLGRLSDRILAAYVSVGQ